MLTEHVVKSSTGIDCVSKFKLINETNRGDFVKKLLAILVGLGVVGYPAATLYFGAQAGKQAQQLTDALSQTVPYVTVASSDYKNGFLSSTQTIKLRPALPGLDAKPEHEITIQNVIEHGPFPGLTSVGAARITHNVIWPADVKAQLAKVWGEKAPLTMVTHMSIGGGGTTTFTSPAANGKADQGTFAFQGLDGAMNFNPGFEKIDYTVSSPGFTASGDNKEKLTIGKIAINGAQTKLAGTERLYVGKQVMSIGGFDVAAEGKPGLSIKQIDYSADTESKEANFVNGSGKLLGSGLKFDNTDWGELEYAFSMQKIHAPSLEGLTKSLQAGMQKAAAAAQPPGAAGAAGATGATGGAAGSAPSALAGVAATNDAMLAAFKQHLPELSKHAPTFTLEKLRFGNAKDFAQLNATVRLLPIVAADLDNPMAMIPKVDAAMNVELSESFVGLLAGTAASRMGADPQMAAAQMTPELKAQMKTQMEAQTKQMVDTQLGALVQEGYIARTGGKVTAQITLKGGQLLVNGKPVGAGLLPQK
jgi:uncharacterized protein YdgA (DUF945 family)